MKKTVYVTGDPKAIGVVLAISVGMTILAMIFNVWVYFGHMPITELNEMRRAFGVVNGACCGAWITAIYRLYEAIKTGKTE